MKTLVFDLDGTMYRGNSIIPSAKLFLDYCIKNGIPYIFLTNNSMRTRRQNAEHMLKMGYSNIDESMFYNSAMAACQFVKEEYKAKSAYYIGQEGLKEAMLENRICYDEQNPEIVFIGLDKSADYVKYSKALDFLLRGASLVGTNKDHILASANGFEIGNGSVVAMFEYASKQHSPDIAKPNYPILKYCLKHFNLNKENIVLIGDNLDTDIKLGYDYGIQTIFVETGVHKKEDIPFHSAKPDYVVDNLIDLIKIDFLNKGCYNQ